MYLWKTAIEGVIYATNSKFVISNLHVQLQEGAILFEDNLIVIVIM